MLQKVDTKERPILFSAPMVRAILEYRKEMTRRTVKEVLTVEDIPSERQEDLEFRGWRELSPGLLFPPCLYGKKGDRLWVRETWAVGNIYDGIAPSKINPTGSRNWCGIYYEKRGLGLKNRPAIHMPRWASRIDLEITDIRVERLQEISEDDAKAEGVAPIESEREDHDWSICPQCGGTLLYNGLGPNLGVMPDCDCYECDTHKKRFKHLWNHINGPDSWAANPWVWVISFRKVQS